MKKNLRLLTLKSLDERPKAGYGLVKDIEKKTGWKPSYGSIYPLLENLKEESLVEDKKEGRKKTYTLTAKGKRTISSIKNKHEEIFESMKENLKVMQEITGQDMEPVIELLKRINGEEDPLRPVNPELFEFRNIIFRMAFDGRAEKHSQDIKGILKKATVELRDLE